MTKKKVVEKAKAVVAVTKVVKTALDPTKKIVRISMPHIAVRNITVAEAYDALTHGFEDLFDALKKEDTWYDIKEREFDTVLNTVQAALYEDGYYGESFKIKKKTKRGTAIGDSTGAKPGSGPKRVGGRNNRGH